MNEINFRAPTGQTCYFHVSNKLGQVYNGTAFENPTAANWANYKRTATEFSTTGYFSGTMPVVASGDYAIVPFIQAGGAAATSDQALASSTMKWGGASEVLFATDLGPDSAATKVWSDLTSGSDLGVAGSIGKRLADNVDATISSRSIYAGTDTSGTTTLLTRLTSGRATNLDNLDIAVSLLQNLLEADRYIDKVTNPNAWALVLIKKGSGALGSLGAVELLRAPLFDVDGLAINNTSTLVGRSVSP